MSRRPYSLALQTLRVSFLLLFGVAAGAGPLAAATDPLVGHWTGSLDMASTTPQCSNLNGVTQSAKVTLDISPIDDPQYDYAGPAKFEGVAKVIRNSDATCTVSGTTTLQGSIAIQGNAPNISGYLFAVDQASLQFVGGAFSATVTGATMSGSINDPSLGTGSFVLTRTSSSTAPEILQFSATPLRIRTGQSTTLLWSTVNASSVDIDNGVGSGPASGSLQVSPASTTTYTLTAIGSGSTTATTTVEVDTSPAVAVSSLPAALVQDVQSGGATTSYVLTNNGGGSTTITVSQQGSFFSQSPTSFTLAPGASQVVTITGNPVAAGRYDGTSTPAGAGVPSGLSVPVRLLATPAPSGPTSAAGESSRVDVVAATGTNPSGSVSFRNTGAATLTGIALSSVPWIIPDAALVEIAPGASKSVSFTIDRSKRPGGSADVGSLSGELGLAFRSTSAGKLSDAALRLAGTVPSGLATVTVVDTSRPSVSSTSLPPLKTGEVALFLPGVGHVLGSTGLFLSDVSVINLSDSSTTGDVNLYYTGRASTASSALVTKVSGIAPRQPVALADVVRSVFGNPNDVGSLQVRVSDPRTLTLNANILNVSDPKGTYGTTIPVLRSDRSAEPGQSLDLAGLRQDANFHTNLFLQETRGGNVSVATEFFDTNGSPVGGRTDQLGPFQSVQVINEVPAGAVSATMTATGDSTGAFSAYATPNDSASRDFWSVVDWNRQLGFSGTAPMLIPVAGSVHGANQTFFRTDLSLMNASNAIATGTLRYYTRSGEMYDRRVTVGAGQTAVYDDVITTVFGVSGDSLGYLVFTPDSGDFHVTSRTFTSAAGNPASYGTGVATLPLSGSLRIGQVQRIGGIDDSSIESIQKQKPGSLRTNFALIETAGAPATVQATLYFSYPAGSRTTAHGSISKSYQLNPHEFRQLNNIAKEILGDVRSQLGDLQNLEVEFAVTGGDGAVSVYVSSTDNGTGDSSLRTE
ncbi:MAG: hypothetical protein WBX15_16510 [Thermoanaerobaculia bacterium]